MSLFFQGRTWTKKEIEVALNERSNQSRKITHLMEERKFLDDKIKKLERDNVDLHKRLGKIVSVVREDGYWRGFE